MNTTNSNTKKFIILDIKGTYQDVGSAIGESFEKEIKETVKERKSIIPNYDSFLEKSKEYLNYTREIFPNLIEETTSIAEAANVNLYDYFFVNNREVYDTTEEHDRTQAFNPDHCTIAINFGKDGIIVGHNEDWTADAKDALYILKATIGENSFVGLNYKNSTPGVSASVNNFGLVQCINDIYQTNQFGVPKNFMARAILECKTLDEAESLVRNTKRASGFNHVLVQGNEVRNIEIAGYEMAVQKVVNGSYVHTNHYIAPEMKALEKFHTKSSEARYKRASELIKDVSQVEQMKSLLSDTNDLEFPICRKEETIGSVIILPTQNKFFASYGHPCQNEFVEY